MSNNAIFEKAEALYLESASPDLESLKPLELSAAAERKLVRKIDWAVGSLFFLIYLIVSNFTASCDLPFLTSFIDIHRPVRLSHQFDLHRLIQPLRRLQRRLAQLILPIPLNSSANVGNARESFHSARAHPSRCTSLTSNAGCWPGEGPQACRISV